jgi:uncharacterized protein YerC
MDDYTKLLWPTEKRQLQKRQAIISFLEQGKTVRWIAHKLKISTATVQRAKKLRPAVLNEKSSSSIQKLPYIFGQSK